MINSKTRLYNLTQITQRFVAQFLGNLSPDLCKNGTFILLSKTSQLEFHLDTFQMLFDIGSGRNTHKYIKLYLQF